MNQKTSDQAWQQLQAHIAGFVGQALCSDRQRIEYKSRFTGQPLEEPSECHQSEQAMMAIGDKP